MISILGIVLGSLYAELLGLTPKGASVVPHINPVPQAACRPVTIETEITRSGADFTFAYFLGGVIFLPGNLRLDGGAWRDVRPGRRVRLAAVNDRYGRGLRALAATFINDSDE